MKLTPERIGEILANEWKYSNDCSDGGAMDAIVAIVNQFGRYDDGDIIARTFTAYLAV